MKTYLCSLKLTASDNSGWHTCTKKLCGPRNYSFPDLLKSFCRASSFLLFILKKNMGTKKILLVSYTGSHTGHLFHCFLWTDLQIFYVSLLILFFSLFTATLIFPGLFLLTKYKDLWSHLLSNLVSEGGLSCSISMVQEACPFCRGYYNIFTCSLAQCGQDCDWDLPFGSHPPCLLINIHSTYLHRCNSWQSCFQDSVAWSKGSS